MLQLFTQAHKMRSECPPSDTPHERCIRAAGRAQFLEKCIQTSQTSAWFKPSHSASKGLYDSLLLLKMSASHSL